MPIPQPDQSEIEILRFITRNLDHLCQHATTADELNDGLARICGACLDLANRIEAEIYASHPGLLLPVCDPSQGLISQVFKKVIQECFQDQRSPRLPN
jgi:hypothetical protein